MKHLSADQLREYKFGLLSEAETAEVAAHLETCAECQTAFQTLEAQFQALEVLRDQPEVSAERLEAVLAQSQKVGKSKVIPFRPTAIITAAAASIAFCLMLLRPGTPPAEDTAGDLTQSPPTPSVADVERASLHDLDRIAGGSPASATSRRGASGAVSLEELRATQPFAPASNIELNVLPRRDDVQITIYNKEDLTLVREKRKLTLKRGWNWLQFMWSNTLIDPTSLELDPKTNGDKIEITQLVYPPRLNDLARWTIFSEFSGEADFELTYFTSGLKWNAFYEATLGPDEQTMQLKSFVRVDNGSGEDYENAQTRLVVGDINLVDQITTLAKRTYPYKKPEVDILSRPILLGRSGALAPVTTETDSVSSYHWRGQVDEDSRFKKEILKRALSEYQLYTIEGRETIPDGWGKRLPSFDVQEIGVTNLYKYDEEHWGRQTRRFLSFANTEACKLGETPLPNGRVRVFGKADKTAGLAYVGAADIKYIPVGEKADLEIGTARKVMVEPKLMRSRTEHFIFDRKKNISGWDEITNWKIELTNARDLPVTLEITRATGSNHWKISTAAEYEKYDANHLKFTIELPPRSKQEVTYELTVHHGTRQDTTK